MPLTILIADDDLGTRIAIRDYLEMSGYLVLTAQDGREAAKMVMKNQPHLIITDITMPHTDGYELVRKVRQQPMFRLLPVIFLTARTKTQERIRAYQLGCDAYLPKPFDLDELGAVVRNLLERSQLIQAAWLSQQPIVDYQEGAADAMHLDMVDQDEIAQLELTSREQEVLNLLANGLSNGQIGNHLHLSPRTVEKYVSSLLRKSSTNNRAELVRYAIEHHLVP
jgi:DNA-binding NarL/FixJ family response regulator